MMVTEMLTFDKVYRDYKDKVSGYVHSRINNHADAEDLVSTIFLKAAKQYDTFDRSKASVSTWIFTITRNTVIDHFRTSKRTEELDETYSYIEEGYENIIREETLDELAAALMQLDERSRDVIVLHYYSGKTLKDIAELMGMSYANMKIVHSKAVAKLREKMNV